MLRFARSPILLSIAFLAVFVVANAQTPQRDTRPRTASISGRVTISGKAAANAKVSITEVKDSSLPEGQAVLAALGGLGAGEDYSALTDADGRYRMTGLPEGKYQVQTQLRACVSEKSTPNDSLLESVSLNEGESRENVDFALVRGGVITGRVTDAEGRPLIARVVNLQVVDEQGEKTDVRGVPNLMNLMMNSDMFQTDDRGVYRIFALSAGRYLVSAGADSDVMPLMTGAAGKYSRVWHPDVTDENQAKIIEVKAGDEITGIDIKLGVAKKTYDALGRVVDDETGKPIAGAGVICVNTKGAGENAMFGGFGGNSRTDEQGNFRLSSLAPGGYYLNLADYESFLTGGGGSYYSDGTRFEIHGANVDGVEIRAKRGATISGVLIIEDADPSAKPILSQTMIMAQPMPSLPPSSQNEADATAIASAMTPVVSRIGSDGGFILKGVRPGKLMIQAVSMTGGRLKIVRIERDGVDISEGINVGAGREEIGGVRIVVGKKEEKQ